MRITNSMLASNFLSDLQVNLDNMRTVQNQMDSGKNFRKPSDDPFNVARAMQMHTAINANTQYNKNIVNTINWLDTTDTALGQLGNVFQSIREKLISAGNGAYSEDERRKIKDEINERVGQISQILNTNFDGEYIFGGTKGASKPVDTVVDPATNNKKLVFCDSNGKPMDATNPQMKLLGANRQTEISQGVLMEYNIPITDVLNYTKKDGTKDDVMSLLGRIMNHLDGKDSSGNPSTDSIKELTNADLDDLDQAMKQVLKVRSEVGAKQNRMESAKDQNEQSNFNMTEILSKVEDVDYAKKTMEYAVMQTVYLASLQTSAKVLQPTLMDYVR